MIVLILTIKMLILEYIWLDCNNKFRSKTKVTPLKNIDETKGLLNPISYPIWNYDGSSTGQATTKDSEVLLKPDYVCKDPFRNNEMAYIVLCSLYTNDQPHRDNTRSIAEKIFKQKPDAKPMYGFELEFFVYQDGKPIGFKEEMKSQADYYCGVGTDNAIGRTYIEDVLGKCLFAGINLTGLNAEVAPSQWEFQVCEIGLRACDQFMVLKYIMERTAENYGYTINYDPKPLDGDWNGSGCHTNFSTEEMRNENGYLVIKDALVKLEKKHEEHMKLYGSNNDKRLTGKHETADHKTFSWGVGNRGCSIRIPKITESLNRGYLEDRRPGANIDPYLVSSKIFETCVL